MNNLLKLGKKIFTVGVVATTIFWSLGVAALVPAVATAATETDCATLVAGDLVKTSVSPVIYAVNGDKTKSYFPQGDVFKSWTADNKYTYKLINQACLTSLKSATAVLPRPGTYLVKEQAADAVYMVLPGNKLAELSATAATALYGANYKAMPAKGGHTITLDDPSWTFYSNLQVGGFGAKLTESLPTEGALVKVASTYYVVGANKTLQEVTATGLTANRFQTKFAHTLTATTGFTMASTKVEAAVATLVDRTQGAAGAIGLTPVSLGAVTVSLASDTPASSNVSKNATRFAFLKFNVSGEGTINTLSVKRIGAGNTAEFDQVYLYEGDTRLTSGRTITSNHLVNFTGLNLKVAGTRTLTVVADMHPTTWTTFGQHAFQIENAAAFTGATVGGTFPITGNNMNVSNISSGSITITKSGSLSNPKLGDTSAKLAEFQLQGGTGEDIDVKSLTLTYAGNVARANLTNFVLKQGDAVIATAAALNSSDRVVFTFNTPFSLAKGASRVFSVYGDLSGSAKKSETIVFYMDDSADLYAIGKTYGYGVGVTFTGYDNVTSGGVDDSETTVDAGQITMAFKGPALSDFSVDKQDVELFRFTINGINNSEIKNTNVVMTAGGSVTAASGLLNAASTSNYTDIKLVDVDTGEVVVGPFDVDTGSDTVDTRTLTDVWTLTAGKTRTIKVTADVANFVAAADETIKFTLAAFATNDIKNLDNNQYIATTDIVPSSALVGNAHNVKAASLTLTLAGTPVAATYINGATNLPMTAVNFAAGTGKDVYVKSIKYTVTGLGSCVTEADCVLSASLYDGIAQVGTAKSLSGTTITFNNISVKVGKGETKTLLVKTDLNTLSSVSTTSSLHFDITSTADDVTASDLEGNDVDPSGNVTGPTHSLTSGGTLAVALAPDTAAISPYDAAASESRIILAGAQGVVLSNYKFTATNEALKLNKIRITLPSTANDEVLALALFDGATQLTEYVSPNTGINGVDFTAWKADFVVAKNASKILTVKANLNTVADGADSGQTVSTTLSGTGFEARSAEGSNTTLTTLTGSGANGRALTLRKAGLVVTEESLPTTGITNNAENDVYKFSMAATGGDVAVKQLKAQVTLNDNGAVGLLQAGSFKLYRGSTNISSLVSIVDVTAATQVNLITSSTGIFATNTAKTVLITFSTEEAINAGTSNVYTLKATLAGYSVTADDDGINVKLVTSNDEAAGVSTYNQLVDIDTTASELAVSLGVSTTVNDGTEDTTPTDGTDIVWSDNASTSHDSTATDAVAAATSSSDWINGYQVKNGPFSGKSMNN